MELLWSLALLACPVGMSVMMRMMMRGSRPGAAQAPFDAATNEELARLRHEVDQLRADRNGDVRPSRTSA